MKKIIVAILILTVISCQKQNPTKVIEQQINAEAEDMQLSTAASGLRENPDFVQLVKITKPVIQALGKGTEFPEFNDGKISFKECRTLYSKLGFSDSTSCAQWFLNSYSLSKKITTAFPNASNRDFTNAYASFNAGFADKACQDKAVGDFLMDVSKCGAFAVIPIIGEVLAGTCMIGALVKFNGSMASCDDLT